MATANQWIEASIVVNSHELSFGQSMTVRVALETFEMQLAKYGLGDDAIGKAICANYRERIAEILGYVHDGH